MDSNLDDLSKLMRLKTLSMKIDKNPKESTDDLKELRCLLAALPQQLLKSTQPLVLSSLYHFIKPPDNKLNFTENQMEIVVDILTVIFGRTTTEKLGLFYNIYAFLINEIYDPDKKNLVKNIREEYKLSIIKCMTVLTDSLSWNILMDVYSKDNAPKLSQILYVSLEVAKSEQLRSLRIASMECIMSISKVKNEADLNDVELCNQIANVFMFFLPGLSSGLRTIALEDEKVGHKIIQMAVRAWGRIVNLLMKNYDPPDQKINMTEFKSIIEEMCEVEKKQNKKQHTKWKSDAEIKDYIKNSERSSEWYKDTDEKLQHIISSMKKLSHHSHQGVRLELADICVLLLENCSKTMPKSISIIVEILITLSEDDYENISEKCTLALTDLSSKFSSDLLKNLLENLEDNFYSTINSVPRIFNGVDEQEQLAAVNLLGGYLKLFGRYKLAEVLYSPTHLQRLLLTLIHICDLERTEVRLLEEHSVQDFELSRDFRTPWKRFRYFSNDSIEKKIETLCTFLSQPVVLDIVSDFLLDTFLNNYERRKEATLILNEILSDDGKGSEKYHVIKTVLYTYLDPVYWDLPVTVTTDEFGNGHMLPQIQNNVLQICLQVDGVGKMALALGNSFQEFLLRTLYSVLEKAGSGHPLIKAAGLSAISNISTACGYNSITELINENSDYFSFYVTRKLRQPDHNENVLNVLAVVMKHSTMDVLPSISSVIEGVLMQSCDEHQDKNARAYLRVFNVFVECLIRWLDVKVQIPKIITKAQKEREHLEFKMSGLSESNDFSDDVMEKEEEFEPEYQQYKKPDPPMHIKLSVSILQRSLHFLPSKDKVRKLLALEILKNGLEVIRDWEDELLPIVHQIWSPLVDRFKEFNEPLIINLSFQLLVTLARLSKDFIRFRTTKDIFPSLLEVLRKSSKESFLKDKGAAYRYTQAYKLQVELLQQLPIVLSELDVSDDCLATMMEAVEPYLSDKQPRPLQQSCVEFFETLASYNLELVKQKIGETQCSCDLDHKRNVDVILSHLILLEDVDNKK